MSAFATPGQAATCTHFVSPTGKDANAGTSLAAPFQTLNRAANVVPAGGTVCVMTGTYATNASSGGVLDVRRSGGGDNAYTTYMAYPGEHPVIQTPGTSWNGVLLQGVHHIIIDGFEVMGDAQSFTALDATALKTNTSNIATNQSGIGITRFSGQATPHHIIIRNNVVHHAPCGGISAVHADYITIENNEVYSNTWWSPYACSGINVYEPQAVDSFTGTKIFVRNNSSHDNANLVPNIYAGVVTDGNGIIIDDTKNTQGPGNKIVYPARIKVENNTVYNNGGSGIHAYYSAHVDMINNTSFWNYSGRTNKNGEIFANASSDVNILNNIMYASGPTSVAKKNWTNSTAVTYDYNVYFNGTVAGAGPNDVIANPNFESASSTDETFLKLSAASTAALHTGTSNLSPTLDKDGVTRGAPPSRGAYED